MTFSASICKNNETILFLDQIFIVGNTCPWFKRYVCIVKQNYVYVITRPDGKKMLIFIFKSNHRGGGELTFDIGTFVSPVFFRPTLFMYTWLQKCIPIHV